MFLNYLINYLINIIDVHNVYLIFLFISLKVFLQIIIFLYKTFQRFNKRIFIRLNAFLYI